MSSTQDVTGRQLPLVTEPAQELGDDWLHTIRPCLPGLTMAAQNSWKNTGLLASVASCGRSQKWGCRGILVLGFKPRHGSHDRKNHVALAEKNHVALARENLTAFGFPLPCSLGSQKAGCSSDAELFLSSLEECRRDTVGRKGVKGLLLVGHEKAPCGFGIRTGDPGDISDGAGN